MKKLNFGVDRLLFNSTSSTSRQPVKTGLAPVITSSEPVKTSLQSAVKTSLDQSINNRNDDGNGRRNIDALIRLIITIGFSGHFQNPAGYRILKSSGRISKTN